jgi:hypothetical protein
MKFNTSKRGLILVLIALCLTIVGAPVFADETTGPYADPDAGLFAFNPVLSSGSPLQMTMFTVKPDEGSDLITTIAPWKISGYTGNSIAFRPAYLSGSNTVSPMYDTLRENFRANPRTSLSPPGGNSPLYCSGGY